MAKNTDEPPRTTAGNGDKSESGVSRSERRRAAIEAASNINKIAAIEASQRAKLTTGERVAEVVAGFCGSMTFVYLHILWFGAWIFVNTYSTRYSFDPYPFTFLTLVVSLEAIFLSTFILISQNHETRLTERRNHLDLQINLLAEQESTKTLELIQLIAKRIGIEFEDEETTEALLEPTDPEELIKEIIEVSDSSNIHQAVRKLSK
jgi:uncharacterized membrane protein